MLAKGLEIRDFRPCGGLPAAADTAYQGRALRDLGIAELSLPVGTLLTFVAAAAVAGVLAAIFPGRRAARIDMLRAITTE